MSRSLYVCSVLLPEISCGTMSSVSAIVNGEKQLNNSITVNDAAIFCLLFRFFIVSSSLDFDV